MNMLQILQKSLIIAIIFIASCSSVKTIIIKRATPPLLNIDHFKKIAIIPLTNQEYQESAQKITSLIRNIFFEVNKFYTLSEVETNKICSPQEVKLINWEEPKVVADLCKKHNIDAVFLVKVNKCKEDDFISTNIDSYYSKTENRYITYTVDEKNYTIYLDVVFRLYEGKDGQIIWEEREDTNISQIFPSLKKMEENNQLLYSLVKKHTQSLISKISPKEKMIKRKVVFE
ncbi:hypothetical protein KKB84_06885 [bacterium]|nr:hypothetical protein [bacterium]